MTITLLDDAVLLLRVFALFKFGNHPYRFEAT